MPRIYLSPSTQEGNPYVTGSGSEEYHMNLLADAMIPYLNANAISYRRNTPDMTAASSVAQANQGEYDLYLALHSNAVGQGEPSPVRGIIAFYYPGSTQGMRAAELIAENLRQIYPLPDRVRIEATTALGEVRLPRFPAVLVEIGYHDNYADATWVENNMDSIAQQLVRALTEFFGLPFFYPIGTRRGTVTVNYGTLNLRSYPSSQGSVIANMPGGATVTVYGQGQGWYTVDYNGQLGYAAASYITLA